jgi:lipoprotein-anchoring transpeptidase ErfK/SrfK
MRRGLLAILLLSAVLAPATAGAQPEVGDGCGPAKRPLRDPSLAFAAIANGTVSTFASPGGELRRNFGPLNQNGVRTVFGVLAVKRDRSCQPAWYQVQLPLRPNGSVGWVRADDVVLDAIRTRLEVDISQRRVRFFRDGRLVLETTAGTGARGTPTPTGSYYVNQRFYTYDPSGPFGPGAIGISAFSPVLKDWEQGGPIAIHGTNVPSSIGRAASHGCIRVRNQLLRRLLWATETGSPVVIHA